MRWARLLKRVFDIDIEYCPNGGGALNIAATEDPPVIVRLIAHLGLPWRAPSRSPDSLPRSHDEGYRGAIIQTRTTYKPPRSL